MTAAEYERACEPAHNLKEIMGSYTRFRDEVGVVMLGLVNDNHPAGYLLLELVRDLEARTGEFAFEEKTV